jgi:hypothetical protein
MRPARHRSIHRLLLLLLLLLAASGSATAYWHGRDKALAEQSQALHHDLQQAVKKTAVMGMLDEERSVCSYCSRHAQHQGPVILSRRRAPDKLLQSLCKMKLLPVPP